MIYTGKLFLTFLAVTILIVLGTLIATGMEVYGQQQEQQTSTTPPTSPSPTGQTTQFQDTFNLENCTFDSRGFNTYFILEPGHQSVLEAQ
jgi:hypothetical protein